MGSLTTLVHMYEGCIASWEDFVARNPSFELFVPGRLRQMDYCMRRVGALCDEFLQWDEETLNREIEVMMAYAEAFYHFAWALRAGVRSIKSPGFTAFDPVGIRNVRNHILVHPKINRERFGWNVYGDVWLNKPEPPAVKVAGGWTDPGLLANAEEVRSEFLQLVADR